MEAESIQLTDGSKKKKEVSGDCQEFSLNSWVGDGTVYWDEENEKQIQGEKSKAWLSESPKMRSMTLSKWQSHYIALGRDFSYPGSTEAYSEYKY